MDNIFGSLGFCLIPIIIAWPVSYFFIKKYLKLQLTQGVQAISLIGSHLTVSTLAALTGTSHSIGVIFVAAFTVSFLSVILVSKRYGTELTK